MIVRTTALPSCVRRALSCLAAGLLVAGFSSPLSAQTLNADELAFVQLINTYRQQNGRAPLKVSVSLTNAAKWMSNDMAVKRYFSHTDSLGRSPWTRIAAFGYTYNTYKGENIAAGRSSAQATFDQWRNSPGHNQNMLSTSYTVMGIGRAAVAGSPYTYYWTNDFGGYTDATIPIGTPTPPPSTPPPPTPTTGIPAPFDFEGDGKADPALWNATTFSWYWLQSSNGLKKTQAIGAAGDVAVGGDYDGDGKADAASWRPTTGLWSIRETMTGVTRTTVLGNRAAPYYDVPVPADYDGDGRTDPAIWRAGTGYWYILESSTGLIRSRYFSFSGPLTTDVPVPGDYDGDRKADVALWRPSSGIWYIRNSSTGTSRSVQYGYGTYQDVPVPADYDGDGRTDISIWRTSTGYWYVSQSAYGGATLTRLHGSKSSGDVQAPADYDGDNRDDIAVWRPSTGVWTVIYSSTGVVRTLGPV